MRILLIEDEEGLAGFIRKGLEEENYAVDRAADGETGLALAQHESYDLIVLDLMLPVMDGVTICRKLRAQSIHTPVLILTARSAVRDRVQGLDSGADDYLTKPFSFEELLARVRALLRRRRDEVLELRHGGLRIDALSRRVYVDGREVTLRPKEYAILEYLVRNKGRVLSRTQILENVWGLEFSTETNIVDVHIKSLRDKVAPLLPGEFIRTVRGMGYLLVDEQAP